MTKISKLLLKWFDQHGRHHLPWQSKPPNPYHVWLSEIMLQQTQVSTVINYFNLFIQHFPSIDALAAADEDSVLAQWAGLGYYARAINLHKCAQIVVEQYHGVFPEKLEHMLALPGIGESTAGAILSISFGQNHAILDGNVKRVLARYHQVKGHYGQSKTLNELWRLARYHTPNKRNADYTQAIMDLGAIVCTRTQPKCTHCPLTQHCQAKQHNTQDAYPNPKPKKSKPTKKIAMLLFFNENDEVYLERRPNKGVWAGLWSLVECKNSQTTIEQTVKAFNKTAKIKTKLPILKHSFTHYHLIINPVVVCCSKTTEDFYPINKIKVGLPAPVKKIIAQVV